MDLTADSKRCSRCAAHKPRQEFHQDSKSRDGLSYICKACRGAINAQRYAQRARPTQTPSTTASDMSDAEHTLPPADTGGTGQDALYVMRYDFDPCGTLGLKVGRAADVQARAHQLGASHNFRMVVLATLPCLGFLESRVHAMLADRRANGGSGREWFDVPLDTALSVIAVAMRTERASAPL